MAVTACLKESIKRLLLTFATTDTRNATTVEQLFKKIFLSAPATVQLDTSKQ